MKLLTTEQLTDLLRWWDKAYIKPWTRGVELQLLVLITAECREHGYAGIEDAYQRLIEKEEK